MEYRQLGRCGLKVSEICLGTMTFGNGADRAESKRLVDLAVDRDVNFFEEKDRDMQRLEAVQMPG